MDIIKASPSRNMLAHKIIETDRLVGGPRNPYTCLVCSLCDESVLPILYDGERGWTGHARCPEHMTGMAPGEPCSSCLVSGGPRHHASPRCESGGRSHCTCDRCF